MSVSVDFQKRFKKLVADADFEKSYELANDIGIGYAIFSKAFKYGIVPKTIVLIRMADYFEVSMSYLLGRTEANSFEKAQEPVSFKERFEELREADGLTHYAVSKQLNLSANYFSQWKNNSDYLPNIDILFSLSELFKVSVDYLLGRTGDK